MKIFVFGLGYVGATATVCLLKDGHSVGGVDVSPDKAAKIEAGQSPVSEPGAEELLTAWRADGRLSAAPHVGRYLADADIATSFPNEGIRATPDDHIVIADDPARQASLAVAARRYDLEHWTWKAHLLTLEAHMIDALEDSAASQNALSSGDVE